MKHRIREYFIRKIWAKSWIVGFVQGGLKSVIEDDSICVRWVRPLRDRWFADPFILDVTDTEIIILVEDFAYSSGKGVISKLCIDRQTMRIVNRKVLLDLPTHLSFPIILRMNNHIYVYPESSSSGQLNIYEYNQESETLEYKETICNDVVWDSVIFDQYDKNLLFTANDGDYSLNIYKWSENDKLYKKWGELKSDKPDMRMAGRFFEYGDNLYCPTQDCSKNYGGALVVRKVKFDEMNGPGLSLERIKTIYSPHRQMNIGFHTLNEYKGIVVVDAQGYRYYRITSLILKMSAMKKKLLERWKK